MKTEFTGKTRTESDLIGAREIPAEAYMVYRHSEESKTSPSANSISTNIRYLSTDSQSPKWQPPKRTSLWDY